MLDLSVYKSQYYPVKINEGLVIHLETPKRKQLKRIMALTKNITSEKLSDEDIDSLYEAASIAFNKNKEGKIFTEDEIDDILSLSALYAFFDGYYTWVAENINSKN